MPDEADRADQEVDMMLQEALYRMRKTKPLMAYAGECFCGEVTGVRFCGNECREDYEREERARRRSGE